eukprot:7513874-Pyramimonas_sp.AAC.1
MAPWSSLLFSGLDLATFCAWPSTLAPSLAKSFPSSCASRGWSIEIPGGSDHPGDSNLRPMEAQPERKKNGARRRTQGV